MEEVTLFIFWVSTITRTVTAAVKLRLLLLGRKAMTDLDSVLWRRQWHPTPVLLPGKSHGWRSLVGCSPWGREESDTTEWLHFHFSLLCIGEGNGNPLQCSCLENPWGGVAQSRTWLKWLSSSRQHIKKWRHHFADKGWLQGCLRNWKDEKCSLLKCGNQWEGQVKRKFCFRLLLDVRHFHGSV